MTPDEFEKFIEASCADYDAKVQAANDKMAQLAQANFDKMQSANEELKKALAPKPAQG